MYRRRWGAEVHAFLGVIGPEEETADPQVLFPELTPRELEVLDLMARGVDNASIARRLVITPMTVRNYVSRIYGKLGVNGRAQAIVLAREAGLGQEAG